VGKTRLIQTLSKKWTLQVPRVNRRFTIQSSEGEHWAESESEEEVASERGGGAGKESSSASGSDTESGDGTERGGAVVGGAGGARVSGEGGGGTGDGAVWKEGNEDYRINVQRYSFEKRADAVAPRRITTSLKVRRGRRERRVR
jgi:hypothetical protein